MVACPGGETGRHIGLKIRRLPEKGRAGSIPAPGTNNYFYRINSSQNSHASQHCGFFVVLRHFK